MSIIVTYMLIDSVSEQEKEFGALSAVADWVKGIGEDMFTSVDIFDEYAHPYQERWCAQS